MNASHSTLDVPFPALDDDDDDDDDLIDHMESPDSSNFHKRRPSITQPHQSTFISRLRRRRRDRQAGVKVVQQQQNQKNGESPTNAAYLREVQITTTRRSTENTSFSGGSNNDSTKTKTTTTTEHLQITTDPSSPFNGNGKSPISTSSPRRKVDKFGFILDETDKYPAPPGPAEEKLAKSREQKWKLMMSPIRPRQTHKMRKRARKGIPDSIRGVAWANLGQVPQNITNRPGYYRGLVSEAGEPMQEYDETTGQPIKAYVVRETIERDIHRTYPKHFLFYDYTETDDFELDLSTVPLTKARTSIEGNNPEWWKDPNTASSWDVENSRGATFLDAINTCYDDANVTTEESPTAPESPSPSNNDFERASGGQASLRRVLRAYAFHDKQVGYCQGMNFLAAMFITFMSEEEAFWLLVSTLNDEPCKMRGLFGEGMTEAHEVLHIADRLIAQFLPKLSKHLEEENVHITMFATQWLLTIYTSSFPFEMVVRVWDSFLKEGWKIVYRVMLALLQLSNQQLMSLTFEDILAYFRDLPTKLTSQQVMEAALKIPLKRRHITKFEKEYRASQQG